MRFAIFTLRDDPDFAIFDVDVGKPPIGDREDYDCAGVFEVTPAAFYVERDRRVLLIDGSGELGAQAILVGNWADQHSGNRAPLTQLWPKI